MGITKRYSSLIGVLVIISFLFFSPLFYLQDIRITSNPIFVNLDECQTSLNPLIGKHLLHIFIFGLIDKQISSFSEIESINITFSGFNILTISLTERTPWISSIVDGKSIFIDKEGYILTYNNNTSATYDDIFIIKGLFNNDLESPMIQSDMLKTVKEYVSLFKRFFPNHNLFLERIHNQFWQLILDDYIVVLLGDLSNLANQFYRINYFLDHLDSRDYSNLDYIDSRINNKLLVKYASKR